MKGGPRGSLFRTVELPKLKMSRELSYFIGLFTADGGFERKNRQSPYTTVAMSLQKTDGYILREIANWLKTCGLHPKLSVQPREAGGQSRVRLRIHSKRFVEFLEEQVGIPIRDKAHRASLPRAIPDIFLADYLRGLNDGDGGVYYYPHLNKFNVRIEGSYWLLRDVASLLNRVVGVRYRQPKPHSTGDILVLSYDSHYDSHRICDYIYRNQPRFFLRRKLASWRRFVKAKRGDIKPLLSWSRRDSMRLLLLKKDGLKLVEIAQMLKRTESAIKNRLFVLRREGHEAA